MEKTSLGTWSLTTRDFSALLNLRIRQEVLGRKLLPGELMQFALGIEQNVFETACDGETLPIDEVDKMLNTAIAIFKDDIE